jgi:hypothetical protein
VGRPREQTGAISLWRSRYLRGLAHVYGEDFAQRAERVLDDEIERALYEAIIPALTCNQDAGHG